MGVIIACASRYAPMRRFWVYGRQLLPYWDYGRLARHSPTGNLWKFKINEAALPAAGPYFFSSAAQLTIRLMGSGAGVWSIESTRKRLPSAATS